MARESAAAARTRVVHAPAPAATPLAHAVPMAVPRRVVFARLASMLGATVTTKGLENRRAEGKGVLEKCCSIRTSQRGWHG